MVTLGLAGFSARSLSSGVPRIQAYPKTAASNVNIKKGHPVVLAADGTMARGTVDVTPVMNAAAILGFSNEWDYTTNPYPRVFAFPPQIENEAGLIELGIIVASPNTIFTGALRPTLTAAQTMVGSAADLWYDAAADMFFVDTGTAIPGTVKIVGIVQGEVGVVGGLVDFIVQPSDSQWSDTTI